jgi:hypothetical protein
MPSEYDIESPAQGCCAGLLITIGIVFVILIAVLLWYR